MSSSDSDLELQALCVKWGAAEAYSILKDNGIGMSDLHRVTDEDIREHFSRGVLKMRFRDGLLAWKEERRGHPGPSNASHTTSTSNPDLAPGGVWSEISLKAILEIHHQAGNHIIEYARKSSGRLDLYRRKKLIGIIGMYIETRVPKFSLTKVSLSLAEQICTVFPGEKTTTYYFPKNTSQSKKTYGGMLYTYLNNRKAKAKKEAAKTNIPRTEAATEQSLEEEHESDCDSVNESNALLDEHKEYLRNVGDITDITEDIHIRWDLTSEIRKQDLVLNKLAEWPLYSQDIGPILLFADFSHERIQH